MTALPFEVNCPKCGARLVVNDPDWIGRPVSCPDCGDVFTAEESTDSELTDSESVSAPTSLPPEIVTSEFEEDPFSEKKDVLAIPPVLTEEEGANDEEETPSEEETPFYYRPFFMVGLGAVALLLLGIIFILIRNDSPVESVKKEETVAILEQSPSEPLPKEGASEKSDETSSPADDSEPSVENHDEETLPGSGEETANLTQNMGTEFFKPSDLSAEQTSETDSEESATSGTEAESGTEATSEKVAEAVAPSPSAESTDSTPTVPEETPSSVASPSDEQGREVDFETFSSREPDSLTKTVPNVNLTDTIDVPKRLSLTVKRIRLTEKSLPEIIRVISELSGIPMELDVDSLPFPIETLEKRVNLEMGQFTIGVILQKAAEFYGLEPTTLPDRIRLTLPKKEKETLRESRFDVSDIVTGTSDGTELAPAPSPTENGEDFSPVFPGPLTVEMITAFLKDFLRDEWAASSISTEQGEPTASAEPFKTEGNEIVFSSNEKIAEEADSLLERIRNIRHLPPKTDKTAEDLIPETLGWEKVTKPASLKILTSVPLREALTLLETSQGIRFLVDLPEMKSVGANLDSPVKISAAHVPLDQILIELLGPLHLSYVILTEDLLWITSREKADQKMTTEIHFYAPPGEAVSREFLHDLIHRLKTEVNPSSWRSDKTDGTGILWTDFLSGSLIIRQSQPTQRAIRRFMMKNLGPVNVPSPEELPENEANPSLEEEPTP